MSKNYEYENYNETAAKYDQTRIPVGLEILLGCFAATPSPLSSQTVLDAGCGTGTCIKMLSDRIGRLHGLELNENMLHQAQEKLKEISNVHLRGGELPELPYEAESFDGLMCNQVLHHLGSGRSNSTFPELTRLLEEAHRVLRPNGVIILNTSSQQQLRDGFWWADLIPQAVERIAVRFPPIEMIEAALRAAGFRATGRLVPLHEVLQGRGYLDHQGPLKKSYRDGDSTWSLADKEELDAALDRVRTMNAQGTMAAYLEQREELRRNVGQATFVFARKA
jgi:ubiquinone/menaquinone biosynthesis C-methylase UbiE